MKSLLIALIIIIAAGLVTYQMLNLAQVECSLCIEFKGDRRCGSAFGTTHSEAIEEAHRTICALLAAGVTETLACLRVIPEEVSCSPPQEAE